jgi:hypothetical protein
MIEDKLDIRIICFGFCRPNKMASLLKSLVKNKEAINLDLVAFIDGARNSNDVNKIIETVEVIEGYRLDFKTLKIIQRPTNIGCANNVVQGVTEVLETCDAVIVLEDDLVVGKYFLKFMIDCLTIYQSVPRVFHISGFNHFFNDDENSAYLTRGMNCWGWGTWDDRWLKLNLDAKSHLSFLTDSEAYQFDFHGSAQFRMQLSENSRNIISTWAIFWYASIFRSRGLCIQPSRPLVKNIGNDGSGERVSISSSSGEIYNGPIITYPENIIESPTNFIRLKAAFASNDNRNRIFIKKLLMKMPAWLQKVSYKTYNRLARELHRWKHILK